MVYFWTMPFCVFVLLLRMNGNQTYVPLFGMFSQKSGNGLRNVCFCARFHYAQMWMGPYSLLYVWRWEICLAVCLLNIQYLQMQLWPWPDWFNDISLHPSPFVYNTVSPGPIAGRESPIAISCVGVFFFLAGVDKDLHCWITWLMRDLHSGTFLFLAKRLYASYSFMWGAGFPLFLKEASRFQINLIPRGYPPHVEGTSFCMVQEGGL